MNKLRTQYLKQGKNLTTLDGKQPKGVKDWVNKVLTPEQLAKHTGNLGWVVGAGDLVVDVDPKNGGMASFKRLQEDFGPMLATVNTPSGGFHIYYTLPDELVGSKFRKVLRDKYPGIDFLTTGSQCVIAGSETPAGKYTWADDMFGAFEQTPAPEGLAEMLAHTGDTGTGDDLGDFAGLLPGNGSQWARADVEALLDKIDPSVDNDSWVKIGMALHDWDNTEGLEIWEAWSVAGTNYDEGETEKRWRSFTNDGGVTLGTISHMAKVADYDEQAAQVATIISGIQYADEKALEFDVLPKLKKLQLSTLNQERITKCVQDRFKDLTGVRLPISKVRAMVNANDVVSGTFIAAGDVPEWCEAWVYVNSHTGFMNMATLTLHKSESFNVENGRFIPASEGGAKPSASKYVADNGFVQKADKMAYLPTEADTIIMVNGQRILNSFNPRTVPVPAEEHTQAGLDAIARVTRHIRLITGDDNDAHTLTQWLAHQVQFPGQQMLWAPIIQGGQGIGKSFFGELMRACLGDTNVGVVSPTQVMSDFNGWATNVVVNILEELRVKGHNRHDTVNALKPLITDRMIPINDKGVSSFTTYNTTNYLCFTNYKDAIPLDDDDRRWWVIFAQINNMTDIAERAGETASDYYARLFNSLRANTTEVNKWMRDYPITEAFKAVKQAPMTDYKLSMLATEDAGFEGLSEVREMIAEGGAHFNVDAIDSSELFTQLLFEHPDVDITTRDKNNLMKRLGYSSHPKPMKLDGKTRRIWTKSPMTNDQIRESFGEKVTDSLDL